MSEALWEKSQKMIRVLLADDQSLVRGALAVLLDSEPDLAVVAETGSGSDCAQLVREHDVDVAILDIEMPGKNGIEATREIAESQLNCRCLIVTTFDRPGFLRQALEAGASGYVVKDTPAAQLAESVRRVHAGARVVDSALATEALYSPPSPLTPREVDVCREVLTGKSSANIAKALHLSEGTVRNHVSSAITKTQASNRYDAARIARDRGWL